MDGQARGGGRTDDVVSAEVQQGACELLPDGAQDAGSDSAEAVEYLEERDKGQYRGDEGDNSYEEASIRERVTVE